MIKNPMRQAKFIFCTLLGILILSVFSPNPALAQCCRCTDVVDATSALQWFAPGSGTVDVLNNHIDSEFNAQEIWMINVLFEDNILPAMMLMAEQLTVTAMYQVEIFGSFLDAKHQLETQRILQKLQAEAHKDYHPSIGMCEFGTTVRSLAASERKGEVNAVIMGQRSLDRQLGSTFTSAAYGVGLDKESRLTQFRNVYCDPWDQNGGLWVMCRGQTIVPASPPNSLTGAQNPRASTQPPTLSQFNKDIDYARTVDAPWTLNVDFGDATLTDDEEDVLALGSYLYAHDVFNRPPASMLVTPTDNRTNESMTEMQKAYMDLRSLAAKRNVAESSYNAIVGMKSSGTAGSRQYMEEILRELGITNATDLEELLGPAAGDYNPSYYAQMEILTKKIYQNPDFFTNLYDKPANVTRKNVAMQAIGLMQKFDMFKSYLRSEASLSIMLELAVMKLQDDVEDKINDLEGSGKIEN